MTERLDVTGMSAHPESARTLLLHFRHPVTDEDRKALLDAINAARAAAVSSSPTQNAEG